MLVDILGESYSEQEYAFLVDENVLIIDHPNSDYKFTDEDSVNIHDLVYDKLYSENGMVVLKDYDGRYKVCAAIDEGVSGFRVIVVKSWWSVYGNVIQYAILFLGLFGVCILAINVVINRMIKWQMKANDNLKEVAESAMRAKEKSLTVSFSLDETIPRTLFGDDVRIKQIVTNLLTNAVKYTPKGGIELHANYRRTGEDRIELSSLYP